MRGVIVPTSKLIVGLFPSRKGGVINGGVLNRRSGRGYECGGNRFYV